MSVIVDILSRYLRLGNRDRDVLDQEFTRLDMARRDVDRAVGPRGGVTQILAGNVEVNPTAGIVLFNPHTGKRSVRLDPDGDAYFGQDIDTPAYTSLAILSNAQSYNSEAMGAGDVLLGDNTSGKANLLWDRSAGQLKFRGGTTVHAYVGTDGKVYAGGGNVVLDNTGITATAGHIGGWKITSTSIRDDNDNLVIYAPSQRIFMGGTTSTKILLDGQNGIIYVGPSSSDQIVLDGPSTKIYSESYSSGLAGFYIDPDFAEFGNIKVRGAITSSIFIKGLIEAKAGSLIVSKSGGELHSDMVVPDSGTWEMTLDDPPGGGFLLDNGDYCRCKSEYTSGVADIWFTVASRVDNGDGTQAYTCTYGSGTKNMTYPAGAPILDYGTSGSGYLYMTADDNAGVLSGAAPPFYSIRTWATNPWTSGNITERLRLGNLYGSYGAGSNNRYGIGIGDYSGGNYLSYNADGSGAFVVKGAAGKVTLDNNGLVISSGTGAGNVIAWNDGVNNDGALSANAGGVLISAPKSSGTVSMMTNAVSRLTVSTTNGFFYDSAGTISTDGTMEWALKGGLYVDALHSAGDVYTVVLTDYTGSTTLVGWSGTPGTFVLNYKKVGNLVYVEFNIQGTGDAGTTASFTLPYSAHSNTFFAVEANDDGTRQFGRGRMGTGGVCTLYPGPGTPSWTASTTRQVQGQFWYEAS